MQEKVTEEIFEASISPEMQSQMAKLSATVTGESVAIDVGRFYSIEGPTTIYRPLPWNRER